MKITRKQLRKLILNEVTERKGVARFMGELEQKLLEFHVWLEMSMRHSDPGYGRVSHGSIEAGKKALGREAADIISNTVNRFLAKIDPDRADRYRKNITPIEPNIKAEKEYERHRQMNDYLDNPSGDDQDIMYPHKNNPAAVKKAFKLPRLMRQKNLSKLPAPFDEE